MAYRNTDAPFADEPEFPDLAAVLDPSAPQDSSTARTTWPYNRYSRGMSQPLLVLRTEKSADAGNSAPDPTLQKLYSIARSMRLLAAPWIVPPPDSESFHIGAGITIPAQDGVFHSVVSFTVDPGRNGAMVQIANELVGAGFTDFSGDLIWQIVRNPGSGLATAERNYENIQASYGDVKNPGKISVIRIFEGDVVQLQVKNVNIIPAGQTIGGLFGGWFYPRTWDDQFDHEDESISW